MSRQTHEAWEHRAACVGEDPELFFAPGEKQRRGVPPEERDHASPADRNAAREGRIATAKAVCARCPVRTECLGKAFATRSDHGVWAQLTEDERVALRRRRAAEARRARDGATS
jgi:WhiB family redox-sensing transcriptional regulator